MNTRLNPTVNGLPHLGHAYLALVNQHEAHSTGGTFDLRFDDYQGRWLKDVGEAKMREYAAGWLEDFEWLGIKADRVIYESEIHDYVESRVGLAFPGLKDPYEVAGTPVLIREDSPQYPYVPYLTATIAFMDHMEGIDTLICGDELLSRYALYCWMSEKMGLPIMKHVFMPRLRGNGELDTVSKTAGTYKIRTFRKRGYSPEMVRTMLAYACLKDPHGQWAVSNIRPQPRLVGTEGAC